MILDVKLMEKQQWVTAMQKTGERTSGINHMAVPDLSSSGQWLQVGDASEAWNGSNPPLQGVAAAPPRTSNDNTQGYTS